MESKQEIIRQHNPKTLSCITYESYYLCFNPEFTNICVRLPGFEDQLHPKLYLFAFASIQFITRFVRGNHYLFDVT